MRRRNSPVTKFRGVSPKAGRESVVGKIFERGRFLAGNEREGELWMVRVLSEWEDVVGAWTGKSEKERLEWGWRRVLGIWFQRQGEAYRKERPVLCHEETRI